MVATGPDAGTARVGGASSFELVTCIEIVLVGGLGGVAVESPSILSWRQVAHVGLQRENGNGVDVYADEETLSTNFQQSTRRHRSEARVAREKECRSRSMSDED